MSIWVITDQSMDFVPKGEATLSFIQEGRHEKKVDIASIPEGRMVLLASEGMYDLNGIRSHSKVLRSSHLTEGRSQSESSPN